jgi:alkylhydroperoxidase family enzyme
MPTDELKAPPEMTDQMVEKITQRYKNLNAGQSTANLIKQRYERKRAALATFSDKIKKGEKVNESDRAALREAGVSDDEIKQIEKSK